MDNNYTANVLYKRVIELEKKKVIDKLNNI